MFCNRIVLPLPLGPNNIERVGMVPFNISYLDCFTVYSLVFIGLISISNLIQSIEIDGNLSDLEWKDANRIDAFRQILPFTLSDPLYKTEVLVYEDERGIYLGYRAYQPTKTMRASATTMPSSATRKPQ